MRHLLLQTTITVCLRKLYQLSTTPTCKFEKFIPLPYIEKGVYYLGLQDKITCWHVCIARHTFGVGLTTQLRLAGMYTCIHACIIV